MREIKFRAWDKEHKVMRDWERIKGWNMFWLNKPEQDDTQVFMQYTGLKDDTRGSRKPIYEQDILEDSDGVGWLCVWDHKLYPASFSFTAISSNGNKIKEEEADTIPWDEMYGSVVVIGNSFEHPHLLSK